MADRDVEQVRSRAKFVATLRRVADAIENRKPVRIQVAARRFVVPSDAHLSIEHEVSGTEEELELQLKWSNAEVLREGTKAGAPKKKALKKKAAAARSRIR